MESENMESDKGKKNQIDLFRKVFDIQKTFTTEPKTSRRIKRGHTTILWRCQDVMESLYRNLGLKDQATLKEIQDEVFLCCGGDYRTVRKYVGSNKVLKSGATKHYNGYLEKVGYIKRVKPNLFKLYHLKVSRPYHYTESLPLSPSPPSTFDEIVMQAGGKIIQRRNVCVPVINNEELGKTSEEAKAIKLINNNNNNTHTNRSSESNNQHQKVKVFSSGRYPRLSPTYTYDASRKN